MSADEITEQIEGLEPVIFYPAYKDITGSLKAGLLLARLVFLWSRYGEQEFFQTDEQLALATGMTIADVKKAKKILTKLGFIRFERKKIPARSHYILDVGTVKTALEQASVSWSKFYQQDGQNFTNKMVKNEPTSSQKTNQQVGKKRTNKLVKNEPTSWSKSYQQDGKNFTNIINKNEEIEEEILRDDIYSISRISYQKILEKWNDFARKFSLPTVMKLTEKRKTGIKRRLQEKEFDFDLILEQISKSPFLLGENSRGWKVDFDFIFLRQDGWLKILEGKYQDSKQENEKPNAVQTPTKPKLKPISKQDEQIEALRSQYESAEDPITKARLYSQLMELTKRFSSWKDAPPAVPKVDS